MSHIILRAAREADADAMLKIYTPYVTGTRASWEYEPPRPDVFAARVRGHLDAGFPWLLAEEYGTRRAGGLNPAGDGSHAGGTSHAGGMSPADGMSHAGGTVLGYAYAGRLGERRGFDWDAEATVYLSAEAHRRHIGTALYTALLALLRAQGYVNCYALITNPNPASEAFHRRMGFAEAAHLPGAGFKQGRWIGLFYYHKLLCTPPAQPVPPVPLCALDGAQVAGILADAARLCDGTEGGAGKNGTAAERGAAEDGAVSGRICSSGAFSMPCTETGAIL